MNKLAAAGIVAAVFAWGLLPAKPAAALELCSCCTEGPTDECRSACAKAAPEPGQCPALVLYGESKADEANPLNGMSLKDLSLDDPTPGQLETFRRFLERHRKSAIKTFLAADRRYRHGRIGKDEMDQAQMLYDEALVNYQHGIRAYLNKIGRKSD